MHIILLCLILNIDRFAASSWSGSPLSATWSSFSSSTYLSTLSNNRSSPNSVSAWIGHPLDPIGVLFDTLAEACVASEDYIPEVSSRHLNMEQIGDNRRRLHHIPVPGPEEAGQTYLILAFEVALIGECLVCYYLQLYMLQVSKTICLVRNADVRQITYVSFLCSTFVHCCR